MTLPDASPFIGGLRTPASAPLRQRLPTSVASAVEADSLQEQLLGALDTAEELKAERDQLREALARVAAVEDEVNRLRSENLELSAALSAVQQQREDGSNSTSSIESADHDEARRAADELACALEAERRERAALTEKLDERTKELSELQAHYTEMLRCRGGGGQPSTEGGGGGGGGEGEGGGATPSTDAVTLLLLHPQRRRIG